jgi:hypothetical protein
MDYATRVEAIELELQRTKRALRTTRWMAVIATAAVTALALGGAGASDQVVAKLRAREVEIVGARGQVLGRWGESQQGQVSLELNDARGARRISLGLAADIPVIGIWDAERRPRVTLGVTPDGSPSLCLNRANGAGAVLGMIPENTMALVLHGADGKPRIMMDAKPNSGSLSLLTKRATCSGFLFVDDAGKASLSFSDANDRIKWVAP